MKRKLVHIITRLDRGGSSEDVLYSALHFNTGDWRTTVIYGRTRLPSEPLLTKARAAGVAFRHLPCLVREISPLRDLHAFLALYRLLCDERPDIVHTHTSKAGLLGRWAAWLYNRTHRRQARIIHSTHGHVLYGYYGRFFSRLIAFAERCCAGITDRLVVLTVNEIRDHRNAGIGSEEKFAVIHSGIEYPVVIRTQDFRAAGILPAGTIVVGSAGRLDPVKGYLHFIEAVRLIIEQAGGLPLHFLLVGDGSQRRKIEERVACYGLEERITLTGWVDHPEEYIAGMDIYVQPSLNEGMGKTILTAQLLERPVIASAVQGIVSLVRDGRSGLLVPPADPSALAAAVLCLARDPALRQRLAEAGRRQVIERHPTSGFPVYSVEQMGYLIEKLYS